LGDGARVVRSLLSTGLPVLPSGCRMVGSCASVFGFLGPVVTVCVSLWVLRVVCAGASAGMRACKRGEGKKMLAVGLGFTALLVLASLLAFGPS